MRKKFILMAATLSGSIFFTGCVYHDYDSPHINGIITYQGQPLHGVTVSLASANEIVLTTTTDDKGLFALNPKGEWNVFIPIGPQDRINYWSVIINQGASAIAGYEEHGIGGVFSGYSHDDHITLACDVSQAGTKTGDSYGGHICKKSSDVR